MNLEGVIMKSIIKNILVGLVVFFAIMTVEFLVTLPFGEVEQVANSPEWAKAINYELLLSAPLAGVITFVAAAWCKPKSFSELKILGLLWLGETALIYGAIGLGNDNFNLIFGQVGIYVLLGAVLAGPLVYGRFRHLK